MQRGDFAEAWRVSDAVLERRRGRDCSHWPRHLQYVWDGSPVDGRRVLVRCYHGLGDTIQFVRLLAPLRERASRVMLWAQPALLELLRGVRGADELLPLTDGAPPREYDVDVELMELPHVLRIRVEDLPGPIPYICVESASPGRKRKPLHVGLAWRSGAWNSKRSLPPAAASALQAAAGVQWFSLQYPPESPPFEMTQLGCRSIERCAARLASLDLVISVDTMSAHLAGAMGLPTWTLLHEDCDWRWMCDRADTPWYPTMRLFRQRSGGDWSPVIDAVVAALDACASERSMTLRATRAPDIRSDGCTASSG